MIVFMFYKTHIFVFFLWQIYKVFLSTEGHSGYEFPWCPFRILPFIYGPSYHDFHHSKNVGNYSASIYVFELLAGTNNAFFDRVLGEKEVKSQWSLHAIEQKNFNHFITIHYFFTIKFVY